MLSVLRESVMGKTRRQIFGQHFLKDAQYISRIINLAEREVESKVIKAVVEIGPGTGALTFPLKTLCAQKSVPLYLVERDERLKEKIDGLAPTEFFDAATDRLVSFLKEISNRHSGQILIVSNLPYSASSQILAQMCRGLEFLFSAVVMIQKELALRMDAPAGHSNRGAFSLLMESYFKMLPEFDVPPGAFIPPPKVMSRVLTLRPLPDAPGKKLRDPDSFEQFCKRLFSHRRKMIRHWIPKENSTILTELGLTGQERPQELNLKTILALYDKGI